MASVIASVAAERRPGAWHLALAGAKPMAAEQAPRRFRVTVAVLLMALAFSFTVAVVSGQRRRGRTT